MEIAYLSRKYEVGDPNGKPAMVVCNDGDIGGTSYGTYQLASNTGAVEGFLEFVKNYYNDLLANYGRVLSRYVINSQQFINEWRSIGTIDPEGFQELQDAYIQSEYYEVTANYLRKEGYELSTKSDVMRAVIFARSVQNGMNGAYRLVKQSFQRTGYPNLTYVNDSYFDNVMITNIYDFLIDECDSVCYNKQKGYYSSKNSFVNGSLRIVQALRNRFVNEQKDALLALV